MSRAVGVCLGVVVFLAGWGALAATQPEFLVFEVRLRNEVLAEAVPAFRREDRVYLPLGELTDALEFAIEVDSEHRTADGWFLDEGRTFHLDGPNRTVVIEGRSSPLPPEALLPDPEDLFVASDLWPRWFPLDLEVDLSGLRVTVTSREPLPLERRLEREARRKGLEARRAVGRGADYPRVGTAYGWFGWPSLDLSLDGGRRVDEGTRGWEGSYSLLASLDALGMGTQITASGRDADALRDTTVRAGRADPAGGLLGPLDATEFQVGDVLLPSSPLVTSSRRGRGVALSSFPLERPDEFDRTTVGGLAQPGWEAELYRNGSLIDFQRVGPDGRYEFADVSLGFGENEFKVALYGPRGQVREEVRRTYVGPGLIQAGHTRYRLGVQDAGHALVSPGRDEDTGSDGVRGYAEVERGLTQTLSAGLALATLPGADGDGVRARHHYLEGTVRGGWGGWYAQVNGARDLAGGTGVEGSVQTRLGGAALAAGYGRFRDLRSERVDSGGSVTSRARARVDGMLRALPVAYAIEARREVGADRPVDTAVEGRLSASIRHLIVTEEVDWRRRAPERTASGRLLLNTRAGPFSFRVEAQQRLSPGLALQGSSVSLDGPDPWGGSVSATWTHRFGDRTGDAFGLHWGRPFPWATMGANLERDADGGFTAGVSVDLALGRDPASGRWQVRGEPLASRGSASARVVFDADADGVAGPDDPPLEGVGFLSGGAKLDGVTGARGSALLTGLPVYRVATVSLDPDTFEDPFWVGVPEGLSFLARPGAAPVLTFLLQPTGEVDGTVYRTQGDEVRPWPGAKVRLVSLDGTNVREVSAAFDGFYLLDRVPLGAYTVQVEGATPVSVALTAEQDVLNGVDLVAGASAPEVRR